MGKIISHNSLDKTKHLTIYGIIYGLKRILRIRSVCTRFWKYLLINSNVEMKISSTIAHNTALNDLFMIASNNDVKITLSNIVEKQQL